MPANLSRLVLRGAAGFLVALAVWLALSEPYTRLLASISESVTRLTESPPITRVVPSGTLMILHRSDLPPSPAEMQLALESGDITFNFILLATLFAASSRALSDRNVFGFAGAAALLLLVHVLAVVSFIKADYALNYGNWSAEHYGTIARGVWSAAPYFYSVVGVHAFAFALWWLFRAPATMVPAVSAGTRRPAFPRAARSSRTRRTA